MPGFEEWIADYREVTGRRTTGSAAARKSYGARIQEGRTHEDLLLATRGAWSDPFLREHGHAVPDTILRASKVERYIVLGQQLPAEAGPAGPVDLTVVAAWREAVQRVVDTATKPGTANRLLGAAEPTGVADGTVQVSVNRFAGAWIRQLYQPTLEASLAARGYALELVMTE